MDWSNERYVRLYVRDTTSWRRLGWDGQCMLMHLLRRADRSGALELDGLEPWEAAMLQTGAPEDMARRGVDAMLRVGVVEVRGSLLVFPNYLAAQECTKSDKLRAREYRERRSAGTVTKRDAIESQNVTVSSQADQARHEPSHGVTPCSAVQCSTMQTSAGESAERGADAPSLAAAAARPPRAENAALRALKSALARHIKLPPALSKGPGDKAAARLRVAVESGLAPDLDRAADDLVKAAVSSGKAFPWCLLDSDPYSTPKAVNGRPGRLARAEPATHDDFAGADVAAQLERLGAL